jgi:hypothetical protein
MASEHETLREDTAREIYEAWGYHYDGRTFSQRGPYGDWAKAISAAERAISLIAERTKEATTEMKEAAALTPTNQLLAAAMWSPMHAASALWPALDGADDKH